jgi:hypothetical protein
LCFTQASCWALLASSHQRDLWMLKKWGLWLTILVNMLGGLSAGPGVGAAPNASLKAAATVGVLISVLVIVLVVVPSSRRALATADQPARVR